MNRSPLDLSAPSAARGARIGRPSLAIRVVCLIALVALSGCWDDEPIKIEEPLEILIGSSELDSGRLTTDFDFGIPVPVVFNTEVGGFSIYSGTTPGFVPLGPRQVSRAPYGFPDGTPIAMRITEIDPEVQIVFSNGLLARVGDEVVIGESPFDTHPSWQLTVPSEAVPEPRFVSFVLTTSAPEYADSEPYTLTVIVSEDDMAHDDHDHDDDHDDDH